MTEFFDAIVIGAGQAGPPLAGRLTAAGMKTAIIERHLFGGTCVNTGCMPTKTLVASAYAAHLARRSPDYGIAIGHAVEIEVGLADPEQPQEELALTDEPVLYARQVELPLRPIDLEKLLEPEGEEDAGEDQADEGDQDLTVGKCIDTSKLAIAGMPGVTQSQIAEINAAVRANPDAPFAPYAGMLAGTNAIRDECR